MTNFDQPFQDYEILDRVGGGAMGTVFKARHKRLNRIVALKILKPSLARDKRYVERLRREARIVASLSHPHIVTGYDLGEEGGYHFFVMEFVEGKSLRQLLTEWGMFSEEYVIRVAKETAEALDHAYQRDVIHRDIKPANILIDESGNVKLTDMGLAKGPADLTLTRDGATVGTPMYISPEQARNPQDVDVRSDLYSLGATLYHMATGVPPFRGDTMAELITNVLNKNVVPPDEANSAVSAGMSLVIRKLLAKNLSVRYQTPRELLDDLARVEKAQPPAVDAGRLEAGIHASNRWLRPVLVVLTTMLVAGAAWWAGSQMVQPRDVELTSDVFLSTLDQELRALPTAGARYLRLAAVNDPPTGSVRPLEERRKHVASELQAVLDVVVDDIEGPSWREVNSWLRDPSVWPYLVQFERHYVQPTVRRLAGVALEQMPSRVSRLRHEQLLGAVARELAERDAEFVARFEQFLASVLPGRVTERLRVGDFASAAILWSDALPTFCDGVEQPLPERLSEALRTVLKGKIRTAIKTATGTIDGREQSVTRALRGEVAMTVSQLKSRLAEGADPIVVAEALQRFRINLGHYWPGSQSFRVGRDPWPEIEQQLMAADHAIDLAMKEVAAGRFDARCDLAWRVFCHGNASSALAVLEELEPATEQQRQDWALHQRCLQAARQVERALLETIALQSEPPIAFLHGAAVPLALRVKSQGESLLLEGVAIDQPPMLLQISELRIGDLLSKLGAGETGRLETGRLETGPVETGPVVAGPLRKLASSARDLGLVLLRLVADEGDDLERHVRSLRSSDRAFVFDRVWPRIERVRGERSTIAVDHESLFARLQTSLDKLGQGGSLRELESALLAVKHTPDTQCTPKQQRLRRDSQKRLRLVRRERNLFQDLSRSAPRGAMVDVRVVDHELVAGITLPARVLQGDAGEGWQMRAGALEFAGAGRPWREQPNLALHGKPGYASLANRSRLELELSFPAGNVDGRSYLIEFDGIALMLVLAANDSVQVELLDGPVDETRAHRAFERALSGAFAAPRALAIAGAWHELRVDVSATAPTQANVVVTFEGKELLRSLSPCNTKRAPDFVLHPLQEVAVRQAKVQVTGL